MLCRKILSIGVFLFLSNCSNESLYSNKIKTISINGFSNKGFALIYSDDLYNNKLISKKIDDRSLIIFQKNLKINTQVKIINILNNKTLIGTVGKDSDYPLFNNSVLSKRIADELSLDISQPYVEISEILQNSMFVAKKAKTYDQEKNVADKAPVNKISINDLNEVTKYKTKNINAAFLYTVKIADFYFNDTALVMMKRIKKDSLIKNVKIKKISDKKYRVYLGPFNNINSLQKSYNDISILEFENIEIIRND